MGQGWRTFVLPDGLEYYSHNHLYLWPSCLGLLGAEVLNKVSSSVIKNLDIKQRHTFDFYEISLAILQKVSPHRMCTFGYEDEIQKNKKIKNWLSSVLTKSSLTCFFKKALVFLVSEVLKEATKAYTLCTSVC